MRKNLVIVRAGNNSLHKEWLASEDRDFDILISYFGSNAGMYAEDGELYENRPGPKWPCLHDLLVERPELVERYAAFWFPDDDLSASTDTINRMFALFHGFGLSLAQPALTADSFYSWQHLLQRPEFALRHVNFVEVMAPVFTRLSLQQCLATFKESPSGWGLDFVWPHLCANGSGRDIAIIDRTPIRHARPIGGELYKNNPDLDPGREAREVLRKYGISDVPGLSRHTLLRAIGEVPISLVERLTLKLKRLNAERLARRRGGGTRL